MLAALVRWYFIWLTKFKGPSVWGLEPWLKTPNGTDIDTNTNFSRLHAFNADFLQEVKWNDLHSKVSFNFFSIIAYVVIIISLVTDEKI